MQPGFSIVARGNGVEFQFHQPQTAGEPSLVSFHHTGDVAAAIMGRLYYRKEKLTAIVGTMPAELADAARTSDAALVVGMYLARGRDGVAALEGDFCLALWDGKQGRLLASRDPGGAYPLFWTQTDGEFAMSTRIRPLLRGPARGRIDEDYLAEFLMLPGTGRDEPDGEKSAFRGVSRVRPGTMVDVRVADAKVERWAFWDWKSRIVPVQANTLEEVGRQYVEVLRTAVRERMQGPVMAHFSGGMDSTTIAMLAGGLAADGLAQGPVHGLTLVYEKLGLLSRETSYVHEALGMARGLVPHLVNGDNVLDYDGFADAPLSDEPVPWLPRLAMNRFLVNCGADLGMRTMMTGIGADEVLDVPPTHIGEMFKRGRVLGAWREAGEWARDINCNRWRLLRENALSGLVPARLRLGLGPLLRRGHADWAGQTGHTIAPWIQREFARRYGMLGYGLKSMRDMRGKYGSARLSMALGAVESRRGDMSRMWLGAPRGVHITHPFLDPRVVCFGLGIPHHLCCIVGRQKPVLAEAARGLLPESIRSRRGKGHFNDVCFMGLAKHLAELKDLVNTSEAQEMGLLDRGVLLQCLDQAGLGVATSFQGMDRMDQTLAVLKWMANLDAWEKADATYAGGWRSA